MISEGFDSLTDLELAFKYWQNIEQWGTPTKRKTFIPTSPSPSWLASPAIATGFVSLPRTFVDPDKPRIT